MQKKYKYKFSVVIPIYNVEKYLEETIESVIDQTIGFEENIQMILVNDGSPDNSEEICLRYKNKYPKNIIYIKQKNAGVSAARNNGKKHALGKYVNFLDSDDKWSLDAFEKVYYYFEKNYDEVDFVSCRMKFFDARKTYHMLDYKYKKTKILDLKIEYDFPQLNSCQCIFKNEVVKKNKYDEKIKYSEDAKFVSNILFDKFKYGIISDVIFYYRKRKEETSAIQTKSKSKDWFLVTPKDVHLYLFEKSKKKHNLVLPYFQFLIMYDLQWRIKDAPPTVLNKKEVLVYVKIIKKLLEEIEDHVILEQKNLNIETKIYILNLKYDKEIYNKFKLVKTMLSFNNMDILKLNKFPFLKVDVLEIENNNLEISGRINIPYETDEFNFYFKLNSGKKIEIKKLKDLNNKLCFFDENFFNLKYNFNCKIPIKYGDKISLFVSYNNLKIRIPINFGRFAKINHKLKHHYFCKHNYLLKTKNNRIIVLKKTLKRIIANEIRCLIEILKTKKIKSFLYRLLAFLVRPFTKKRIWLISDRINVAGDNGEALFDYVLKHKNKNIKPYFLISKKCPNYSEIKKKGKVIAYNSFKHKLFFLLSPYIISSHADDYVINPFMKRWYFLSNFYDYKYVFLQHGITKDNQTAWLNKNNKNISLFITAIKEEYKSILSEDYRYNDKEVKLTGFPRYDLLVDTSSKERQKTILIAPTWRRNLVNDFNIKEGITRSYNENFKKSDYYNFYNSLINNNKLLELAKKNNLKIKFVLHPAALQQSKDFKSSKFVNIKETITYKTEFEKDVLLITDYSSVFFDFAYLKKPIIYSQFDKQTFYDGHIYNKGYFEYEKDGFGDVLLSVDEVVKKIEYYIKNDFKMEDKYVKRVEDTFAYTDRNNCKRVYEEILKLDNNN